MTPARSSSSGGVNFTAPLDHRTIPLVTEVDQLGWLVGFISFTMLLLIQSVSQGTTMIVVLLFMAPWGLIILRQPNDALRSIVLNWALLALPLFALFSLVWSDYPSWTLRASIQFIATTIIGILAGYCVKPRELMSALLSALALVTVLSALFGKVVRDIYTGEYTFVGLFGSKNYFGLCVSLLLLTAVIVVLDKSQPRIFRIMGLAASALSPPLLVYARSTGALVISIATLTALAMLRLVMRLPPRPRLVILVGMFLLAALVPLLGSLTFGYDQILRFFGKNATLTGRTLLWEYAARSIAEQPVLGAGYQAFWQLGNWPAEQLWLYSYIPNKYGYHFHNTYFQVGVDLGLVGLFFLVMTFFVLMARIVVGLCGKPPGAAQMFAVTLFIFLLLRTPIEVDLFFQFQVGSILICLAWIYLRPFALTRRHIGPIRQKP